MKASPSETLLTWSAVVKWDGLASGAFPGCVIRCFTLTSRFLLPRTAKVTIYATQCRHFLFLFFPFSGIQRILGYVRPWRIAAVRPPKTGKRRSVCGQHLEEPSDWDRLRAVLWCNWPSDAPLKDADPELRHSDSAASERHLSDRKAVNNKHVFGKSQEQGYKIGIFCHSLWKESATFQKSWSWTGSVAKSRCSVAFLL